MNNKEPRKVKTPDGTIMFVWEGKLHSWSGPAKINPDGSKEYYLHGIKLTEDDYKKRLKEREGIPPAKKPGTKIRL